MHSLFGKSEYSPDVDSSSIKKLISGALNSQAKALMIMCCDQEGSLAAVFDKALTSLEVPVFGGVFPALIHNNEVVEHGLIIVPVYLDLHVYIYSNLSNANDTQQTFGQSFADCDSAMVFVDGLTANIDVALTHLFNALGDQTNVFGGGAGSLSFVQKPCLFSNQGVIEDAMVIVTMTQQWNLAIGHGWEVLNGPFLANQVDDNKLIQLNFQPASEVYKSTVEAHDGRLFAEHDFFELAKTHPFGLQRLDDDLLVRDPITLCNDTLVCVGNIPENTMLYILQGSIANLQDAAANAVKNNLTQNTPSNAMLFDCISRKLFMNNEFTTEINKISAHLGEQCELTGALVLGEIASSAAGPISFHNKTAVTAITSINAGV